MKKRSIAIVLIFIIIAVLSVVAANEAGIITINIFNSSSSQVYTNISNSTIEGQTNFTNSQAAQNITLTNSTLTLNINGQNITIYSQGDKLIISSQGQSMIINPDLLYVAFIKSQSNQHGVFANAAIQYDFNITVTVPTSMNFLFGRNVTHSALNNVLMPLADRYNLQTRNETDGTSTTKVVMWTAMPIVNGENLFSLFSNETLSNDQIQSLTNDLYNAFTVAMSGKA